MPNRIWVAFLVALLTLPAPAVVRADKPKAKDPVETQARWLGERVRLQHFDEERTAKMSPDEKVVLLKEAFELQKRASGLYKELATAKLTDDAAKQKYAERLVEVCG